VSLDGGGFIVTGGTGALGRAVVLALLGRGARVAVPYRSESAWQALRAAAFAGAPLFGLAADLAKVEDAKRFVDEAAAHLGRLDGVAALAGAYVGAGPLESAPVEEWEGMLQTNLATVYATCRAALPHLLKRGGSVVTVSSRLAATGGAGAAAYAVSKAAVQALTRVLALENAERGVRFNCVVPGTIDTAANRASMPRADASRWTPPEAIAAVVVFLLSAESGPVTGAVIPVDQPGPS
jgi:NAD(P)-dependent dehydrogenase (short-subunit alcohol dehydrogenase family)